MNIAAWSLLLVFAFLPLWVKLCADVLKKKEGYDMSDLHVGDVVTLKSGGPAMTVSAGTGNRSFVYCKWFAADLTIRSDDFHVATLRKVPTQSRDERLLALETIS